LLEKKIICPAGRKNVPGKPMMFRTTQKFLEYFGLRDLSEMPTLEDFNEELEGEVEPEQGELTFNNKDDLPAADTDLAEDTVREEASTGAHDPETGNA
ncbi:MAG: SMC-Scp complex subunit ScpB, partial [Nitrospinaceae bacterium]